MDTERSPGSKKIPSVSNQASGGSTFISSLDNLVTYLVLGVLVVAINVALIVCIGSLVYILNNPVRDPDIPPPFTFENTTKPDVGNKVITSPAATSAGQPSAETLEAEVKKYMNLSVSPCEDFYSYACGGWHALKEVQDSTVEISRLSIMKQKTTKLLIDLLQKTPKEKDPHYITEPRKCFAACNNKENLQERGTKPFFVFLNSIGKFPILDSTWDPETSFSLPKAIVSLSLLNIQTIFSITRSENYPYTRFRITHPDFQLPLRGDEEWMKYILRLLGVDTNNASIKKDIDDMYQFENALYTFSKERQTDISNTLYIREIQDIMPAWFAAVDFFKLMAAGNLTEQKNINENLLIATDTDTYIKMTGKLFLESWDGLNKQTDQPLSPLRNHRAADNYILKILLSFTSWLDPKFKSLKEFNYPQTNNRETTCVENVIKLFPAQVLKLYVNEVYQSQSNAYINALTTDMKNSLLRRVKESIWSSDVWHAMSVRTREVYAGYLKVEPDEALNNVYIMGPTDEFFEYSIETLKNEFKKSLFPAKGIWYPLQISFSADAGSYIPNAENFIVIQAPFLQPPTMSLTWPRSMNYGAIGTFLSHEMARGWLDSGQFMRFFKDLPIFGNKRECFEAKYDKYMFQGSKINGQQTALRNICDNVGIKTSFLAYQNFVKSKGTEPQVNGLNFTHKQLFFVAYAQLEVSSPMDIDILRIVPSLR